MGVAAFLSGLARLPWRLLGTLALAAGAFWAGHQWHAGRAAQSALGEREHAAELQRIQRRAMDAGALQHAQRVRTIHRQLEAAHARIAHLSGRDCLDPGTVGLLNDLAGGVRAPAGQPAAAPSATAPGGGDGIVVGGLRHSTDRDVARALAICRAGYATLSDQIDRILDIEDARHGPVQ